MDNNMNKIIDNIMEILKNSNEKELIIIENFAKSIKKRPA